MCLAVLVNTIDECIFFRQVWLIPWMTCMQSHELMYLLIKIRKVVVIILLCVFTL